MSYRFDQAMKNPAAEFEQPSDVLDSDFSVTQQREILESWQYSLQQRQNATDESMEPDGADENIADRLTAVTEALRMLDA